MIEDYYMPNEYHKCINCGTDIANKKGSRLVANTKKAHIFVTKQSRGLYVFNACKTCAQKMDLTDQSLLDQIHTIASKMERKMRLRAGAPADRVEASMMAFENDGPKAGWSHVKTDMNEPMERIVNNYENWRKKQEQ